MSNKTLDLNFLINLINSYKKLSKSEREKFLDFKLRYYQFFIKVSLTATCLSSILFLVSDAQLSGTFGSTVITRFSVMLPLILYLIVEPRIKGRRLKTFSDYFLSECIVWATIWSVYHLTNKVHFAEGSFSMNLIFIILGLGTSAASGLINYAVFFAGLIISNTFNCYPNFDIILSLNIPTAVAVTAAQVILSLGAYDNYLTNARLEKSLMYDALTGVGNRERLQSLLSENKLVKDIKPTSVIMIDVDNFKSINDTNGHEAGDIVLKYVGDFFNRHMRNGDNVIRYGGDEFLLIMYNCKTTVASKRIKAIREKMNADETKPYDFSFSAGIAAYTGDFKGDLECADKALYHVKQGSKGSTYVSK
ncbi:MAG: GGDEF domain-containing protein [Lachnospiraceae bacterium]|uniref:GGDEF domain-containing protein n=1 Tax=Candidatus Weimeria bifida TaxID=2599074 RepID=A0A6N7IZY8_9FIRM|nr:GGDEF domain-containing protein [Candidatus Weimeria bifida]RRF96422.1 MAG: GGDEF domain-containing protein [Lachnospiraceae bacterium]